MIYVLGNFHVAKKNRTTKTSVAMLPRSPRLLLEGKEFFYPFALLLIYIH
jgi:hypothetical protein